MSTLNSRPDRWELAKEEFRKAGIEDRVERFPAIEMPENPSRGNHLSHAQCIRKAKEAGAKNVLIFEDDIQWLNDPLLFRNVIFELDKWDLLYLGVNTERDCYQISHHLARLTFAYSTHAYAINHTLFDKLIELNEDPNTIHNDVSISNEIVPNYICLATIPLLAGQRKSYSNIMNCEMDSNPVFLSRFESHLIRKDLPVEPYLVTFVIPTIGRQSLVRAVDSIINQPEWNWRAIVVFDGREPNYSTANNHVKIITTERLQWPGLVRNVALPYVTTAWTAFLDDDDYIAPTYIEALKRHIGDHPEADVFQFTYRDQTNGNTRPGGNIHDVAMGETGISFVARTKLIQDHNIKFMPAACEDFFFVRECIWNGAKYFVTHDTQYYVSKRGRWEE